MSEYLGFEPVKEGDYYFISYNSNDSDRIRGPLSMLNAIGFPMWYDYGINYDGDKWWSQIAEKIEQSQGFLLFITKDLFSKAETVMEEEYNFAKKSGTFWLRKS